MAKLAAGIVKDGKIEILSPCDWPEGTKVIVQLLVPCGLPDIDGWDDEQIRKFVYPDYVEEESPTNTQSTNGPLPSFMEELKVKAAMDEIAQHTLEAVRQKMGLKP